MTSSIMLLVLLGIAASGAASREIVFPDDSRAVFDLKREGGAKGDGVADDTDALQSALERACGGDRSRFVYLPSGTYRITRTLVMKPPGPGGEGSMVGPWLWGQNRDRTVIRLDDGAAGFGDPSRPREAIRGVSRPDGARMNADFFDRTVVNLTIDTGRNPGAVGIKFYSNNTGLMQDVRVRGSGTCGIDLGFNDQNGPLLLQDVEVEGFATGIRTGHILNSQTLSRVTVRAREVGLRHHGQVLAVEGLRASGAPVAVESGENGVLVLVDSVLEAPRSTVGSTGHAGDRRAPPDRRSAWGKRRSTPRGFGRRASAAPSKRRPLPSLLPPARRSRSMPPIRRSGSERARRRAACGSGRSATRISPLPTGRTTGFARTTTERRRATRRTTPPPSSARSTRRPGGERRSSTFSAAGGATRTGTS